MNKHFFLLLIVGALTISGCNDQKADDGEIIEINLTEALKNQKDFPLSRIVKDVEILEIESNKDCFIQEPHFFFLGDKYILIYDFMQNQLFLFNRDGRFIRKIGGSGKGPGEYYGGQLKGTMSLDEKYIILTDSGAGNVIVYNLLGDVLAQKDLSKHIQTNILWMDCQFDNLISFLTHRPWEPNDKFSSVLLFDLELNKVGEVLPRENDENLVCNNILHAKTFSNRDGAYFWEMYNDTVYQYFEDGSSIPKFRFTVDKNNLTRDLMFNQRWSIDMYQYTFPWDVHFLPGYLVANFVKDGQTVLYDLKSGESFSMGTSTKCLIERENNQIYNCIENDVFGFEPARLWHYRPNQNICVQVFEWGRASKSRDLDCIQQLDVTNPEIRDQLMTYCNDPSDDLGVVLLLMKMK